MTKRTFDLESLQEYAFEKGGKLLSKEYTNSTTNMLWQCGFGHKWQATPLEVLGKKNQEGKWCPKCLERQEQQGPNKLKIQF